MTMVGEKCASPAYSHANLALTEHRGLELNVTDS